MFSAIKSFFISTPTRPDSPSLMSIESSPASSSSSRTSTPNETPTVTPTRVIDIPPVIPTPAIDIPLGRHGERPRDDGSLNSHNVVPLPSDALFKIFPLDGEEAEMNEETVQKGEEASSPHSFFSRHRKPAAPVMTKQLHRLYTNEHYRNKLIRNIQEMEYAKEFLAEADQPKAPEKSAQTADPKQDSGSDSFSSSFSSSFSKSEGSEEGSEYSASFEGSYQEDVKAPIVKSPKSFKSSKDLTHLDLAMSTAPKFEYQTQKREEFNWADYQKEQAAASQTPATSESGSPANSEK